MTETLTPSLASLPSSRRRILIALRRRGEASADELAAALGITPSAVRQHLAELTAAELVASRVAAAGPGRPPRRWRLAARAEDLFPKRYGELASELLDYVEDEDPDLVARAFERRRRRRVEGARGRLAGRPFAERVAELARVLDEDGYLADFQALPDGGFRVTEHNCAILSVARRHGLACSTEIAFIREVLPDARVERVAHMMEGAHVCAYEVRPLRDSSEG